jgi:molybdate transport system regulatory protein
LLDVKIDVRYPIYDRHGDGVMPRSKMTVGYKIWLSANGKAFGEGPYLLLQGIAKTGSLRQAAIEMGMSYRKAWAILRECEKKLGFTLIERKVGGSSGGYSKITSSGRELMKHYGRFCDEIKKSIDNAFHKNLGNFVRGQKTSHLRT